MSKHEAAVRSAATALHAAVTDARAAGLSVAWPRHVDGLASIVISETKRASANPVKPAK